MTEGAQLPRRRLSKSAASELFLSQTYASDTPARAVFILTASTCQPGRGRVTVEPVVLRLSHPRLMAPGS